MFLKLFCASETFSTDTTHQSEKWDNLTFAQIMAPSISPIFGHEVEKGTLSDLIPDMQSLL